MSQLWTRMRLPLAVFAVLVMTLALARIFSGPEDGWVRNEQGEWVAHGEPSGPPPAGEYQEPASHLFVPVAFLVAFAAPLFLLGIFKSRDRLTFTVTTRDQKLFGYLGTALILFGFLTGVGLLLEVSFVTAVNTPPESVAMMVIAVLMAFAMISCVLGVMFFVLKRVCDDHYQIMKGQRELNERIALLGHAPQS